jgi:plasmid stabilization system protein ParE
VNRSVQVRPEARADILEAARWYRDLSRALADRFLKAVGDAVEQSAAQPTAHPIVDLETGARRIRLHGFPYRVFYLVEGERVIVFAVAHDRRDRRVWHDRID